MLERGRAMEEEHFFVVVENTWFLIEHIRLFLMRIRKYAFFFLHEKKIENYFLIKKKIVVDKTLLKRNIYILFDLLEK